MASMVRRVGLALLALALAFAVTLVRAVHTSKDATPDDNDALIDEISFQMGALDTAVVGGLLPIPGVGNDVDGDGYEDNVTLVKYVPRFNFPGSHGLIQATDSFTYVATDGLARSNVGTVQIDVERSYRPPEGLGLRCYADETLGDRIPCLVDEDTDLVVEIIAKDPDGILGFDGLDTLAYQVLAPPEHGDFDLLTSSAASAVYRYRPRPNYYGADSLRYSVSDGRDTVESEPLGLTVLPVDDEPVFKMAHATASRGYPAEIHITVSDPDARDDERLPDEIWFSWGNGVVEQPGEIVKNASDARRTTAVAIEAHIRTLLR